LFILTAFKYSKNTANNGDTSLELS
jgi:hypothetical protein